MTAIPSIKYISYAGKTNVIGDSCSHVSANSEMQVIEKLSSCEDPKPFNLRFTCRRFDNTRHPSIEPIYQACINDKIHDLLQVNSSGCHNSSAAACGNFRGSLGECSCQHLNRKVDARLRTHWEKIVVGKLEELAKTGQNSLNLVMFPSGELHAELVVLFKIIDRLRNSNFKGSLNLFLIDMIYTDAITKGADFARKLESKQIKGTFPWNHLIGEKKSLEQFLNEIALALPSTIQVTGAVFAKHTDYITRAASDHQFHHDLLIGLDIAKTDQMAIEVQKVSRSKVHGVILAKLNASQTPVVCAVDTTLTGIPLPQRSTATTSPAAVATTSQINSKTADASNGVASTSTATTTTSPASVKDLLPSQPTTDANLNQNASLVPSTAPPITQATAQTAAAGITNAASTSTPNTQAGTKVSVFFVGNKPYPVGRWRQIS